MAIAASLALAAALFIASVPASPQAAAQEENAQSGPASPNGAEFLDEEGIAPPGANDPECEPDAKEPPVVLVHGTFAHMAANFAALAPTLAERGYCVYALNYGGNVGPFNGLGDVEDSARELDRFVDDVLAYTGSEKVSLVGHSQGGLMPRYYIKNLGGAEKVEDLVGIAPANHGTLVQERLVPGTDYAIQAGALGLCDACVQQGVGSEFLTELNSGDETPGEEVDYTVVATRTDETVIPYSSGFISGPTEQVSNITLQEEYPLDPAGHLGVIFDPNVYGYVLDALEREGPARP